MFIFLFCCYSSNSQNKITIIDSLTLNPVKNVSLTINHKPIKKSDFNGLIEIDYNVLYSKEVVFIHENYKEKITTIMNKNDTVIYLVSKSIILNDIEIKKKVKDKKIIERTMVRAFFNFKINLNHGDKIAQLIVKKKEKEKINKIKVNVIDIYGVKNLKYLPFKVSIYDVSDDDFKPNNCIYSTEIIRKSNNTKWVDIDVSFLDLFSNEKDLFLVFEVLDKNSYPIELISSKIGLISAVPQIKARIYNPKDKRKCYIMKMKSGPNNMSSWDFLECHFDIKFEYKNNI